MQNIEIKVKKCQVVCSHGTDIICLTLNDYFAFPTMQYGTIAKIECEQGKGAPYCREHLGLEPEILNTP